MWNLFLAYWPQLLAVVSLPLASVAIVHAAMTKEEVRSAIGWVGVILLSPIVGALIYAIAGINRIRRASIASGRAPLDSDMLAHPRFDTTSELVDRDDLEDGLPRSRPSATGSRVISLTTGNSIAHSGDRRRGIRCDG